MAGATVVRRMMRGFLAALLVVASSPALARDSVDVHFLTAKGRIDARLDLRAAPVTVCNFLRYALGQHYDGGRFFRTVRSDRIVGNPVPIDVIQLSAREGEEADFFGQIPLEKTSVTGLTHKAGALSMARWGPDTATSSFSIVVKASPAMDFGGARNADGQGFAVFGYVTRGMDVVRDIQAGPADGETLLPPVGIERVIVTHRQSVAARMWKICPPPAGPAHGPSRR